VEGETEETEETVEIGVVHPADMTEGTRRPEELLVNSPLTSGADIVDQVIAYQVVRDVVMVAMEVDLEVLDVVGASSEVAPTGEIHQASEIDSQAVAMVVIVHQAVSVVIVNKVAVAMEVIVNKAEEATEVIVNKEVVVLAEIVHKVEVVLVVAVAAVLAVVLGGEGADLPHHSKT